MPATFDSFGIKFLYPDNWTLMDRSESEGDQGVTLELPSGGFFSIEKDRDGQSIEQIVEAVASSFESEYDDVEREELAVDLQEQIERGVEFHFYYLDLLIISRLFVLNRDGIRYLVQMQAESRDFDSNERVFEAILKQL